MARLITRSVRQGRAALSYLQRVRLLGKRVPGTLGVFK